MKGFSSILFSAVILVFISLMIVSSFSLSIKNDLNRWRLTRLAMIHSNIMASEYMQNDIGIIDENKLYALRSQGYRVEFETIDPEDFNLAYIRENTGYFKKKMASGGGGASVGTGTIWFEGASYALPMVYGSDHKYGLLKITLKRNLLDMPFLEKMYSNLQTRRPVK